MTPRATALPIAITITLMTTTAGFGQSPFGRVLDLGHPLSATDPTWTGTPRMGRIAAEEHNGTHVDAPSHFGGRWSVDQIPADRLVRPGVCVAVTSQPDDYQISAADVKAWEAKNGPVPEGAIVDSPGGTRPQ